MGENKAFLMLEGRPLIDHIIRQTRVVAADTFIVGDRALYSAFGRIVPDIYKNCGPLGGIHAALERTRTGLSLILPVDMPFITSDLLSFLIEFAKNTQATVTVPRVNGRLQPLCAVYRAEFSVIAEIAIRQNQLKIESLFHPDTTQIIEEEVLQAVGFSAEMFDNLNSPEDFERATQQLARAANIP